jgi:hypothetical protein
MRISNQGNLRQSSINQIGVYLTKALLYTGPSQCLSGRVSADQMSGTCMQI